MKEILSGILSKDSLHDEGSFCKSEALLNRQSARFLIQYSKLMHIQVVKYGVFTQQWSRTFKPFNNYIIKSYKNLFCMVSDHFDKFHLSWIWQKFVFFNVIINTQRKFNRQSYENQKWAGKSKSPYMARSMLVTDERDGRQFFYCHSVILLSLGNSTATFHISTAMAVEIDFHFLVWH